MSIKVSIRVKPNAKRTWVGGTHGDALVVSVAAPAVDGKANEAVIEVIAQAFGVKRRAVTLLHGLTGRDKLVEIEGEILESRLQELLNAQ